MWVFSEGGILGSALERWKELWNWKAEGGVPKGSKGIKFAKEEGVQHRAKENRAGGTAGN